MNRDTLLLMQLYWRLDQRADGGIGRFGWARRVLVFGAVIGLSALFGTVGSLFIKEGLPTLVRLDVIPGLLLAMVLLGTALSGFNQALQALFLSDDLEKLFVAPIPPRSIVTAKLLGRLPTTLFFMLAGVIPALMAFGVVMEFGPLYFLLTLVVVLAAPLFGIAVGAIVAILMVRLLPARRLSEWMGAASIVIGTLFSLLFLLPRLLGANGRGDQFSPEAEALITDVLNRYGDLPLPTNWASRAMVDLGQGTASLADFGGLMAYFLLTIGLFLATILLADRLYLSGWLRMQSSGAGSQGLEDEPGIFGGDSLDLILGYKDWLLRVRDRRMLATLFSGLVLAGFVGFMVLRPQDDGGNLFSLADEFADNGILAAIFGRGVIMSGFTYFIAWMSFSRVARSALSIERSAVYILKSAPVSPSRILRAKVLGILIPFMLLVSVLLIGGLFMMDYSLLWMPYAWFVMLIMGFGMIAFTVSLDFVHPDLDWEDPRKMTNRKTAWPSAIGTVFYNVIAIAIAVTTFGLAVSNSILAIPIVLFGLGLLAGGTWFFIGWRLRRVEAAWPRVGMEG